MTRLSVVVVVEEDEFKMPEPTNWRTFINP